MSTPKTTHPPLEGNLHVLVQSYEFSAGSKGSYQHSRNVACSQTILAKKLLISILNLNLISLKKTLIPTRECSGQKGYSPLNAKLAFYDILKTSNYM